MLEKRGLKISDKQKAELYLSNISYYRLRAYTYPFQDNLNPDHTFKANITFEQILDSYVFDRELRLIVFDAIERIEVALRTQIIYHFALKYGSHWHEESTLYSDTELLRKDINTLNKELQRSSETFIRHYYSKYTSPLNPPAWMSLEVTSLGLLSKFYENLKMSDEKKQVAKHFGLLHPYILESWMHSFAHVRNICAHHGRLWNRSLSQTPKLPRQTAASFLSNRNINIYKIYPVLSCMEYILNIISPQHRFAGRIKELLNRHPLFKPHYLGFPKDWEKEPLWK